MRALIFLPLLLLAVACAEEPAPEELQAEAARDVAMVEAANETLPPLRELTPDPISHADIERHAIYGLACNYAPGTSLGTRVIAREADAFVKIDGELFRLAADAGSPELPARTRSLYDGREFSLRLAVEGEGEPAPGSTSVLNYEGTIDLRDRWGRSVYSGTGLVQCGV